MKPLNLTFEQKYLLKHADKKGKFSMLFLNIYSLFFPNRMEKVIKDIEQLYDDLDLLLENMKSGDNYTPTKELVELKNSTEVITDNLVTLSKRISLLYYPSVFVEFMFALSIIKTREL
jgi:hypothetical protein